MLSGLPSMHWRCPMLQRSSRPQSTLYTAQLPFHLQIFVIDAQNGLLCAAVHPIPPRSHWLLIWEPSSPSHHRSTSTADLCRWIQCKRHHLHTNLCLQLKYPSYTPIAPSFPSWQVISPRNLELVIPGTLWLLAPERFSSRMRTLFSEEASEAEFKSYPRLDRQ